MHKLSLYKDYLRNLLFLIFMKLIYHKKIQFSFLELIGKSSSLKIGKNGHLILGKKIYTRSNFNLLVENGICAIGDGCFFNHNCNITCIEKVVIGRKCTFGNNLVLVDHDHNFRQKGMTQFISDPVIIGEGSWIGANVVILKGTKIGKNCVIAAGSIVRQNIPDNHMYINGNLKLIDI